MSSSFRVSLSVLTVLLAGQGCAVKPQPYATPGSGGGSVAGRVGFEVLADPDSAKPSLSEDQWFQGPILVEAPLPEYPQQALEKEAGPLTVVVRIIVEEDGTVREIFASPLDKAAEGGVRDLLRTAIDQAVRKWKFKAATIYTLPNVDASEKDPNVEYRVPAEPVRTYLDLRFKFDIVDGRGRVQLESKP